MELIHKFLKMESENNLFDIGKEIDTPIWDIVRYGVFRNLNYPEVDRKKLAITEKKSIFSFFFLLSEIIKYLVKFPFLKADVIIFTSSRYINENSIFYDKSATPIIDIINKKILVIESLKVKNTLYTSFYDLSNVFRRFYRPRDIDKSNYNTINETLRNTFGHSPITQKELNDMIWTYKAQYQFYKLLLMLKKPECLIICTGNPKASIKASRRYGVKTYLVQHASIELDEIDYSYPKNISYKDFILFPDYVLTFGPYWCKNINTPARKIISIGNSLFAQIPKEEPDDSILFISTIIHGRELSSLVREASIKWPDLKIIYKLHPNEYHNKDEYASLFKNQKNIQIVSNEIDTNILIAKCQLVVLIVSAVLYEALQQGKKVAIYKRVNYKRQLLLGKNQNLFFFDNLPELLEIIEKDRVEQMDTFFEPTNNKIISSIFNTQNQQY